MKKKDWISIDWRNILTYFNNTVVLEATRLKRCDDSDKLLEEDCIVWMARELYSNMFDEYLKLKEKYFNEHNEEYCGIETITSTDWGEGKYNPKGTFFQQVFDDPDDETKEIPINIYIINSFDIEMMYEGDIDKEIIELANKEGN